MSQPSSPSNPDRSPAESTPRRLISPAERFAPPAEPEAVVNDPFVPEAPTIARRDDEMARRHLPPRERRKHERLVKKREKRPARPHPVHESPRQDSSRHEQRAQAEREFAQQARVAPPKTAIKARRRMPVW
ncbi:MAG: hypothetical protein EOP61_41290, partial [Sphingomonadales bacterium]